MEIPGGLADLNPWLGFTPLLLIPYFFTDTSVILFLGP